MSDSRRTFLQRLGALAAIPVVGVGALLPAPAREEKGLCEDPSPIF